MNAEVTDEAATKKITNSPTLASLFKTPDKAIENLSTAEEEVKSKQAKYEFP